MIGTGLASMAAVLAGAAVWLWPSPPRRLLPHGRGAGGDEAARGLAGATDDAAPSTTLALEMLAAAIGNGAAVPRALECVGRAWGGAWGASLEGVADALHGGAAWHAAWTVACGDARHGTVMASLADALEPAYRHGASPLPRIEAAVDQIDADERRRIEESAARIGVALLAPTGLLILPAFIMIGVLPVIASYGMGVLR